MQKRISLAFTFLSILLSLCACSQKPASSTAQKTASNKGKEFRVSGMLTQTQAYCGGARPPDELLAKMTAPTPFPGKKLFVRSGAENSVSQKVLAEITADSTGHFTIMLPTGTYCVVEAEQVPALDPEHFRKKETQYLKLNESCLKGWWSKCVTTFEVGSTDKTDLNLNFHFACATGDMPCMKYIGPLPQ